MIAVRTIILACALCSVATALAPGQWTWKGKLYNQDFKDGVAVTVSEDLPSVGGVMLTGDLEKPLSKLTLSCDNKVWSVYEDHEQCRHVPSEEPCDLGLDFVVGGVVEGATGRDLVDHSDIKLDSEQMEPCPNGKGQCHRYVTSTYRDNPLRMYMWVCNGGNMHGVALPHGHDMSLCKDPVHHNYDECNYLLMDSLDKTPLPDSYFVQDC